MTNDLESARATLDYFSNNPGPDTEWMIQEAIARAAVAIAEELRKINNREDDHADRHDETKRGAWL